MTTTMPTATQLPREEEVVRRPTREEVVRAICAETGVPQDEALGFVEWTEWIVTEARSRDYQFHILSEGELICFHDVLEMVAPDGAVAEPGSAHALLEAHVLSPERGELGLLHDMYDPEGSPTYCTVQVRLSVAR